MIWAGSTCGCARFSTGRRGVGPNPTPPSRQLLPKCLSPNDQSLTAGKDRQYGASGSVGLLSIFFFACGRAVQIRPAPPSFQEVLSCQALRDEAKAAPAGTARTAIRHALITAKSRSFWPGRRNRKPSGRTGGSITLRSGNTTSL